MKFCKNKKKIQVKEGMGVSKDQEWCARCKELKKHWLQARKIREA
jgi:hypothetical protein